MQMKGNILGTSRVFGLAVLAVLSLPGIAASPTLPGPNVAERYLLAAVNQERAARGLLPLQSNPMLVQAARYHALQMAKYDSVSHRVPGEPDLPERGATAGAHFSRISENVAKTSDASMLHGIWMHSKEHRDNLLDPSVNAVGIAVVARGGQFYGVEDFGAMVKPIAFNEQELTVARTLTQAGLSVGPDTRTATLSEARETCMMETGYAGRFKPWFIMRYTASHLDRLPSELESRIHSGRYHRAIVAACSEDNTGSFTAYNIAVLLYP